MATGIPLPGDMGSALLKGIDTGSNMFTRIMHPILEREKLKQLEDHFQQQLGLSKAAAARAAQAAADNHKIAMNKLDPTFEAKQYEALENYWKNKGATGTQSQPNLEGQTPQYMIPTEEAGQGMGVFTPSGMQEAQQAAQMQEQQHAVANPSGPDLELMKAHPMLRGWYKKHYGIDPLTEAPQTHQEKLQDKFAIEQEKASLKDAALQKKTIDAARNDLPHLEQTLEALEKMKMIAEKNPDLFGHSGIFGIGAEKDAERFSKTTKNPNAGAWQTLGLGPIVAAETKMSSKGNQLALKQALANKANFSEAQEVAISKLDTQINQIKKNIEETRKLTGTSGEKKVVVTDPSGKQFRTTEANAAHLPAGWKRG